MQNKHFHGIFVHGTVINLQDSLRTLSEARTNSRIAEFQWDCYDLDITTFSNFLCLYFTTGLVWGIFPNLKWLALKGQLCMICGRRFPYHALLLLQCFQILLFFAIPITVGIYHEAVRVSFYFVELETNWVSWHTFRVIMLILLNRRLLFKDAYYIHSSCAAIASHGSED